AGHDDVVTVQGHQPAGEARRAMGDRQAGRGRTGGEAGGEPLGPVDRATENAATAGSGRHRRRTIAVARPPREDQGKDRGMTAGRFFVGTSGFAYKEWIGPFYPPGTKSAGMLGYYAGRFNSVEVNFTFRRSPTASMIEGWSAATSEGFVFALK